MAMAESTALMSSRWLDGAVENELLRDYLDWGQHQADADGIDKKEKLFYRNLTLEIIRDQREDRRKFIPTGQHQKEPWDALYYTFASKRKG